MSISAEQFNKLVTKDEYKELVQKVDGLDEKFDKMMNTLDGIAKNVDD